MRGVIWYRSLQRYIVPENVLAANYTVTVCTLLLSSFSMFFVRDFLDLKERNKILNRLMIFLAVLPLVAMPFLLLLDINTASQSSHLSVVLNVPAGIGVIIYYTFKKVREAYYLAIAWLVFLLGGIIYILKGNGLLPVNFFTTYIMQFGSAIEAILMSVALADRMGRIRREQKEATGRALEKEKQLSNQLEAVVSERTEELENRNADLIELNRTKDKFLSILAHDLRGPMGNIAVLFEEFYRSNREITRSQVGNFARTTRNIYELLEDLLTWAKSQKGSLELEPRNFDINRAIDRAMSVHMAAAEKKQVHLARESRPGEYFVYADNSTVTTIIRNLVSNAVKFTPAGGNVTVRVSENEKAIKIEIIDNGVGIPADRLSRIFSIGERHILSPGTDNEKGTGLGLVLCYEFAEANNGRIDVESRPSGGSVFILTLPAGERTEEAETVEPAGFENMKVLVVEDNQLNMQTTLLALEQLQMQVKAVSTGEEAVKESYSSKFDFILMDVDLSGLNGIEAATLIKEHRPDQRIIALTSYERSELQHTDADRIFNGYLQKPLQTDLLRELLARPDTPGGLSSRKRILLIDDSIEVKDLISVLLQGSGFELDYAADAGQGIEKMGNYEYEHVLLDLELPVSDGFQAIEKIHEKYPEHPPVVAITAHDSDEMNNRVENAGFTALLSKPFRKNELLNLLKVN